MARVWEQRYPGVETVLIEPEPNDELMFEIFDHELRLADRHRAPPLQSVTLKLAGEYKDIRTICARHGIETSDAVRNVIKHFAAERRRRAPSARSSSRRSVRGCCNRARR
jgi:NTE family protein